MMLTLVADRLVKGHVRIVLLSRLASHHIMLIAAQVLLNLILRDHLVLLLLLATLKLFEPVTHSVLTLVDLHVCRLVVRVA